MENLELKLLSVVNRLIQWYDLKWNKQVSFDRSALPPGGGGHLGIFWVGMCRPELQIGTPF